MHAMLLRVHWSVYLYYNSTNTYPNNVHIMKEKTNTTCMQSYSFEMVYLSLSRASFNCFSNTLFLILQNSIGKLNIFLCFKSS